MILGPMSFIGILGAAGLVMLSDTQKNLPIVHLMTHMLFGFWLLYPLGPLGVVVIPIHFCLLPYLAIYRKWLLFFLIVVGQYGYGIVLELRRTSVVGNLNFERDLQFLRSSFLFFFILLVLHQILLWALLLWPRSRIRIN